MNNQPHRGQLKSKMIKGKGINIGKVKYMGGIGQGREKTQGKSVWKTMQNTKMNEMQKEP
jgi:hypothetical protein